MQTFVPYIIITKLLSLKIYISLWKLIYNKHIHHLVNPNKINVIGKCNHVEKLMSHATAKWHKVIRLINSRLNLSHAELTLKLL